MRLVAPVIASILAATAAAAAGDPVAGQALARSRCAECHNIGEPGEPGAVRSGPDFRVIAGKRSAARIRAFLTGRHRRMPQFVFGNHEVDDLTRYIASLKSAP